MRTTLNLDEDVLDSAQVLVKKIKKPLKAVINEALRIGLKEIKTPPREIAYVTPSRKLGLKKGIVIDQIQDLLSRIEGEAFR